jgi:hypothetical protein
MEIAISFDVASNLFGKAVVLGDKFRKDYFVHPDGSDENLGFQEGPAGAFRTIQRAIDAAFAVSTVPTSAVTIHIAHGHYLGGIVISGPVPARPDKNGLMIRLVGDEDDPSQVYLEAVGKDAVRCTDGACILVAGVTLRPREKGCLFTAKRRATIAHRNCILDAAASETINAHRYGEVYALGPTTVTGSSAAFAHATSRSTISFYKQTLTFREGLHFPIYLWGVKDATVSLDKCLILGQATGPIGVHINGLLNVVSVTGEWEGSGVARVLDGGIIATDETPVRPWPGRKQERPLGKRGNYTSWAVGWLHREK